MTLPHLGKILWRDSSVGRAEDWKSLCPQFDSGSRHQTVSSLEQRICYFYAFSWHKIQKEFSVQVRASFCVSLIIDIMYHLVLVFVFYINDWQCSVVKSKVLEALYHIKYFSYSYGWVLINSDSIKTRYEHTSAYFDTRSVKVLEIFSQKRYIFSYENVYYIGI